MNKNVNKSHFLYTKMQTKFKSKLDTILGVKIQTTNEDYFRNENWNKKQSNIYTNFGAKIQITFIFL